jgi:transposase-like protein
MGKRVRQRDVAKERFWRRTVAEHRRSGLSIREFCSRRGLSEPLFYAWRRELAQRDGRAVRKASPPAVQPHSVPRFVSLKLAEPADAATASLPRDVVIEIVTRGGHTLRVPPGVDRQTLAEVWALLEGQPC